MSKANHHLVLSFLLLMSYAFGQEDSCQEIYDKAMESFMVSNSDADRYKTLAVFDTLLLMDCNSEIKDLSIYRQGTLLIDLGLNKEAVDKLDPKKISSTDNFFLAHFYNERAIAFFFMGKHHREIKELNRAINLDISNTDFLYNRANTYFEIGKFSKAYEDLLMCESKNGDNSVKVLLGLTQYKLKSYDLSLDIVNDLLKQNNLSLNDSHFLVQLKDLIGSKKGNLIDEDIVRIRNTDINNVDARIRKEYKKMMKRHG